MLEAETRLWVLLAGSPLRWIPIIILGGWLTLTSGLSLGAKTIIEPPATTTTTVATTTATAVAPTTTTTTISILTTVPPPPGGAAAVHTLTVAAPSTAVSVWQPADECSRLLRPVSAAAMRWCPYTAMRLYQTGDWQPGDLTKLMRTMDCESGGNPSAKNPRSSASGLFQFLASTWARWGPRAAERFGYDNPGVFWGYDNISSAVLLFKAAGPGPWPNCGRR